MTLQSSGPISLGDINTELELGATSTISLNDAGVRDLGDVASGAISLSDFYGKSNADVYPDYVTIAPIYAYSTTGTVSGTSGTATLTGFNQTLNAHATFTYRFGSSTVGSSYPYLRVYRNGGLVANITFPTAQTPDFTVSPNDEIYFVAGFSTSSSIVDYDMASSLNVTSEVDPNPFNISYFNIDISINQQ